MTVADALPRLAAVCLTGATHADYALTVARATLYRRLATGDIRPLMRPMARREDEAQYESRVSMTIQTVSSSWGQLRTPFYAVARLRGGSVTRRFDYVAAVPTTEATRRAARLEGVVSQYYERKPLENYLAERLSRSHCMSDPNAWLLTEFAPFDYRTQVAQPYPLLLPCEAAVDYSRAAGVVQYLTGRFSLPQGGGRFHYTCYLADVAIDCWPVLYDTAGAAVHTLPEGSTLAGSFADEQGRVQYEYRLLAHGAGRVPASVLGYVVDEEGTGESFVSPLHNAVPFLLQMLKVGSENDIVMSQMAFPIRVAYVPKCPGYTDTLGQRHACTNGVDPTTMAPCGVCGGLGTVPVPITAAETVTVPMPPPGEKPDVAAKDLLNFVSPATDNPKLQLEYLQSRRALAQEAVHGVSDTGRTTGTKTATEIADEREAQLTALAPFADWFAAAYTHHATVAAAYADVAQGLTVVYEFPADLEKISEDDLYAQRKAAVESGADAMTLQAIDARIAYKQHSDDEASLVKNKVKRRFVTFLGYTEAQVLQMATLGYISAADRVARTHADIIFDELELEKPDFYSLAYGAQAPLVQAKIEAILGRLPATPSAASSFRPPSFTSPAPAVPVVA